MKCLFEPPVRPGVRLITMFFRQAAGVSFPVAMGKFADASRLREKIRPNVLIVGRFQCFVRQ
jgi:hypothetical protein